MRFKTQMAQEALLELLRFMYDRGEKMPFWHLYDMAMSVISKLPAIVDTAFWLGYQLGKLKGARMIEWLYQHRIYPKTRLAPWDG